MTQYILALAMTIKSSVFTLVWRLLLGLRFSRAAPQVPADIDYNPDGISTVVVTRGHTNRKTSTDFAFALARHWSQQTSLTEIRSHRGAWRFWQELREVDCLASPEIQCFRGRLDDGRVQGWRDMGPPPPSRTRAGRYNAPGMPVLYLSDSIYGVKREMGRQSRGGVYVQSYLLPTPRVGVADLAAPSLSSFVRSVFDIAESANVPGRQGPDNYFFSQAVAGIVRSRGFAGMLVPGVLGQKNKTYNNVVIFQPYLRWRTWSEGEKGFRFLP